jgi:hypothetical protein
MPAGTNETGEEPEEKRKLLELLEDLQAIGQPPGGVQKRDPFEFPERRGL